jgi:hypothetical protein
VQAHSYGKDDFVISHWQSVAKTRNHGFFFMAQADHFSISMEEE